MNSIGMKVMNVDACSRNQINLIGVGHSRFNSIQRCECVWCYFRFSSLLFCCLVHTLLESDNDTEMVKLQRNSFVHIVIRKLSCCVLVVIIVMVVVRLLLQLKVPATEKKKSKQVARGTALVIWLMDIWTECKSKRSTQLFRTRNQLSICLIKSN